MELVLVLVLVLSTAPVFVSMVWIVFYNVYSELLD